VILISGRAQEDATIQLEMGYVIRNVLKCPLEAIYSLVVRMRDSTPSLQLVIPLQQWRCSLWFYIPCTFFHLDVKTAIEHDTSLAFVMRVIVRN
jgi:hypothetical protein